MEFSLGNLEQIEIPLKPKPTIKIAGEGGYQLTYRGRSQGRTSLMSLGTFIEKTLTLWLWNGFR